MLTSIHQQKIYKRPLKKKLYGRKRDTAWQCAFILTEPQIVAPAGKAMISRFLKTLNPKLPTSFRRRSIYLAGFIFIVLFGMFLSSTIPGTGMTFPEGLIILPDDSELENFLFYYLQPESGNDQEEPVKLPDPDVMSSLEPSVYTIKKNDTISGIAQKNKLEIGTLISFNNIKDVRKVKIGMELRIPSTDGILYRVRSGDSLSGLSHRFDVPLNNLVDINNINSSIIRIGQELFIPGEKMNQFDLKSALGELFKMPTVGRISSPFGMRPDPFTSVWRMHYGIDIANERGTPIYAAMDGTVVGLGTNIKSYGKYIILKHIGGYQSMYGHLDKWLVTLGQRVSQGVKIGEMGDTGLTTGPHLHFSIYKNQIPVNPAKYLY
ncbi:MAG: M23 family metallopeptidase [Spirochaetota bacterium]